MEFDKSKVYTALNADESLIGAKGYFSDSLSELTNVVTHDFLTSYYSVLTENHKHGFIMKDQNHIFNFFYLVEPAPEKWYVTENANKFVIVDKERILKWYFDVNDERVLFSGNKNECNQWIEEHSKPKCRPFKDCDEFIETWCNLVQRKCDRYKVEDYSKNTLLLPTIWVKAQNGDLTTVFSITCIDDCGVSINSGSLVTFDRLLKYYTFLDGSVCGVEE